MVQLISGALVAGYLVAALFFLRFRRETGDRLFLAFAVAFAILAGQRLALALIPSSNRSDTIIYGLRLLAFVLILAAIVDKNRKNG
ncbi:MAG: hypothetical protein AVDCRST_MAG89-2233 [uncultured Gemmatimonadetes bacterium]|uniref:Uncharacterized protein n=1 Tax=uncultured Gemmatimonadota bacterium TaxID=203437 RepID=A0A6J4LJ00_9BACT|nr:MAG: hypothetical protein AVDCRST_MAG89-2233 [uncultured Gemmatimonadota bacterium]